MKKLFVIIFILCFISRANSQGIAGSWIGLMPGANLHLVFNIKKTSDTSYSATFDSPDQKAFGIACSNAWLKKDSLMIGIATINGGYKGAWDGKDHITGTYSQGGGKIALDLKRMSDADKAGLAQNKIRPQTPKPPFGYHSEEIEYDNVDKSMHYGATFTRPEGGGKYAAVIIISGSGTQDRNGTMLGHQPYWVLADYLTKHGIAVLRVDDRGAGKSSLGTDIGKKTSLDFSYDVEASLNYLETRPDVDKKHLGLIGHSEGGMIAPMVAARRKDVSFIVMWGASEVGGAKILAEQYADQLKQQGVDAHAADAFGQAHLHVLNMFSSAVSTEDLDRKITSFFDTWKKAQTQQTLDALNIHENSMQNTLGLYNKIYSSAWLRFFITYNPEPDLSRVTCSVLAINGDKDTQVNAAENLGMIKRVLTKSGNRNFEVKALPGLNHLLQTAKTGEFSEYEKIDETMSPMAMEIISNWIKLHTR